MKGTITLLLCVLTVCSVASAKVVLLGNNLTLSFDDVEAKFAPSFKASGEIGVVYLADPVDACGDLTNKIEKVSNGSSPFVLIRRGRCGFEDKVRKAQKAGFKTAIIYDNQEGGVLVAMAGDSAGIKIHAVFISKASGETLKKYAGSTDTQIWILPSVQNSAWSVMAISFISLLGMSAVLATCFFVRRHRIRQQRPRSSRIRDFHGMSRRLVKAMPSLIFTSVVDDSCTSTTCAICLEDYTVGEKLRVLPCRHRFHAFCVDSWLTAWRTFCPVCKRDARTSNGEPPASDRTPLLYSYPSSVASSSILSSFRSSLPSASGIQIAPPGSLPSTSVSFSPAHASTSYIQLSFRSSHRQSPPISVSRSSLDLRHHGSLQRSYASQLASSNSIGYPSVSPLNSRHMSRYAASPSNASPSVVSSSGHQFHPLRCSESAGTFSPFASNYSLPEC